MSNYHDQAELLNVPFGFNLSFDKNIAQLTIERLSAENERLKLDLSIRDARINQLESLVIDLYHKIDRLINESEEGDEM